MLLDQFGSAGRNAQRRQDRARVQGVFFLGLGFRVQGLGV